MQTFLPYPDFAESAKVLDSKRLGKQRVEAYQILLVLTGKLPTARYRNHPAVKMWRGYERALLEYTICCCDEWSRRGFLEQTKPKCIALFPKGTECPIVNPPWLGHEYFHRAHQSNLLRKDSNYYSRYFPGVPDNLQYYWPS